MSRTDNSTNKDIKHTNGDFSTDENKTAIALGYDAEKNNAPKVLAKGEGFIAEKIIQIAIDEGIEIREDADLVQILKAVDIDSEIPIEAFSAVAEIISYVYTINGKQLPSLK